MLFLRLLLLYSLCSSALSLANFTSISSSSNGTNLHRTPPKNSTTFESFLASPFLELPQRDFFSISERISALRNVFETILSVEREFIWNPIVPSRMSRGFFLVKLLSNVLRIMPFRDVSWPNRLNYSSCSRFADCERICFRASYYISVSGSFFYLQFAEQVRDGITSRASCLTCNIVANMFTSRLFSTDVIAFATRAVCVAFRLQTPRVCYGLINSFRVSNELMCKIVT